MDCDKSDAARKEFAVEFGKRPKFYVLGTPVEMVKELESLLNAAKDVCKQDPMPNTIFPFYCDFMNLCEELLDDDAIDEWEPQIHNDVHARCKEVLELCVPTIHIGTILEDVILSKIFNPNNRFHVFNASKISESVPAGSDIPDDKLYARPLAYTGYPQGWLVDLLNRFGELGGFDALQTRFQNTQGWAYIRNISKILQPYSRCHELLTVHTIVKYFMPIVKKVQKTLYLLLDNQLGENAESIKKLHDLKVSEISGVIGAMTNLLSCVPGQKELVQNLESEKVRLIFKLVEASREICEFTGSLDSDFNVLEWDTFLQYFPTNWKSANESTREKILKLLQQSAENWNDAEMFHRVLTLFWNLVHSVEVSPGIMEKALNAHFKTLRSFNLLDCTEQIFVWLEKYVDSTYYEWSVRLGKYVESSNDKWSFRALREILELFKSHQLDYCLSLDLDNAIRRREELRTLVMKNLTDYLEKARQLMKENPEMDEKTFKPDGQYNHEIQVQTRLDILSYLEKSIESLSKRKNMLSKRENIKPTPTNDIIKEEDLWKVVENCPEDTARGGFTLLKQRYRDNGLQIELSDTEIHKTLIVECQKRLKDHNSTLSSLTSGASDIDNKWKKGKIAKEIQTMAHLTKFLQEYMIECGWGTIQ